MKEITRKIVVVGTERSGKSTLIDALVENSDNAFVTSEALPGIRVIKKIIPRAKKNFRLIFWDMAGNNDFDNVPLSFFLGASLVIFVLDASQMPDAEALKTGIEELKKRFKIIPLILVMNKTDLVQAATLNQLLHQFPENIDAAISAKHQLNLDKLLDIIVSKAYADVLNKAG